jgi:5-methylcytosine-specific restriction endonuclease McrA
LNDTAWETWIDEVKQGQSGSFRVCYRCCRNFNNGEIGMDGMGYICHACSRDQQEERDNELMQCIECKKMRPRKLLQPRHDYLVELVPRYYSYACPECMEIIIDREKVPCIACGTRYSHKAPSYTLKLCSVCRENPLFAEEHNRLRNNIMRAEELGLPATLTLKQWLATLDYFNRKCAYCLVPYKGLEHYIPITLGGGTTVDNCVPSCSRCNVRKRDKHPDQFACLFPADNMDRIRDYLATNRTA